MPFYALRPTEKEFSAHLADDMPHQFTDGATTYRWGLVLVGGVLTFRYEEVV